MKELIKKLYEVKKEGIILLRNTKAYNYKYATLDQIQDKLNPVLEKQWLIVIHIVKDNKVITKVIDTETEQEVSSEIDINTTKPQDKGSEITYYRRYNLVCLFDLPVEDDDWKKAQDSKKLFWEKEYKNLVEKKWEYIDYTQVSAILNDKWYNVSKERDKKLKDLFK